GREDGQVAFARAVARVAGRGPVGSGGYALPTTIRTARRSPSAAFRDVPTAARGCRLPLGGPGALLGRDSPSTDQRSPSPRGHPWPKRRGPMWTTIPPRRGDGTS